MYTCAYNILFWTICLLFSLIFGKFFPYFIYKNYFFSPFLSKSDFLVVKLLSFVKPSCFQSGFGLKITVFYYMIR